MKRRENSLTWEGRHFWEHSPSLLSSSVFTSSTPLIWLGLTVADSPGGPVKSCKLSRLQTAMRPNHIHDQVSVNCPMSKVRQCQK